MKDTRLQKNSEAEQWRLFWNSIGGSEVDPSSVRRQKIQGHEPGRITQRQIDRYVHLFHGIDHALSMYKHLGPEFKHLDVIREPFLELLGLFEATQGEIVQAIRSNAHVEPGPLNAIIEGEGRRKTRRI